MSGLSMEGGLGVEKSSYKSSILELKSYNLEQAFRRSLGGNIDEKSIQTG